MIELATELWSTVVSFVATYALKRILDALAAGGRRDEALAWASLHFLCNLSFAQFDLLGKWHSRSVFFFSSFFDFDISLPWLLNHLS